MARIYQKYDAIPWDTVGHDRTMAVTYKGVIAEPGYDNPVITVSRQKKSVIMNTNVTGKQIAKLMDKKFKRKDQRLYWKGSLDVEGKNKKLEVGISNGLLTVKVAYKTKTGQEAKPVVLALYNALFR